MVIFFKLKLLLYVEQDCQVTAYRNLTTKNLSVIQNIINCPAQVLHVKMERGGVKMLKYLRKENEDNR